MILKKESQAGRPFNIVGGFLGPEHLAIIDVIANVDTPGERVVQLANSIARLRPDDREVLVLRNFKELSFEQVAKEMGRSVGATRVLWLRAVKRLREVYEEDGYE